VDRESLSLECGDAWFVLTVSPHSNYGEQGGAQEVWHGRSKSLKYYFQSVPIWPSHSFDRLIVAYPFDLVPLGVSDV
jgi:hypothetical protein